MGIILIWIINFNWNYENNKSINLFTTLNLQ